MRSCVGKCRWFYEWFRSDNSEKKYDVLRTHNSSRLGSTDTAETVQPIADCKEGGMFVR